MRRNELEGIAKSAASQLALIDGFADAEIRAIDDAVAQVERKVMESAARLRRLGAEVGEDAAREKELPAVTLALKGMDLGGATDASAAVRRERGAGARREGSAGTEHAAMDALAAELDAVHKGLDAFVRDALQKLGRSVEADLERGPHGEIFRRAHAAMLRASGPSKGPRGACGPSSPAAEKVAADEARSLGATSF